jgi:hypothetical protein
VPLRWSCKGATQCRIAAIIRLLGREVILDKHKILTSVVSVSDQHYAAIGKVASNWAALEHLIDSMIWRMGMFMDNEGACVTAQIPNMARRLDALIAIIRLQDADPKILKKLPISVTVY